MEELIGQQIDNYQIEALLGEGGMGAVYRAWDLNLNRLVALKVMNSRLARQPEFKQRFQREAQAEARLDHPSIVPVHSFGINNDRYYIIMAYVPGGTLSYHIRQMQERHLTIKLDEVLFLMAQVADALDFAHRNGVVHRDIKPDNVLLKKLAKPDRPGEPPLRAMVTDFGLAKLLDTDSETVTNAFIGTLSYMSPEQILDEKNVDHRSDIYSLGVMLYHLATGRLPLEITSPTDAVMKHMREVPPEPRSIQPGLPPAVNDIIQKAMAKKPDDRYQEGGVLAAELRIAAAGFTKEINTQIVPQSVMVSLVTLIRPDVPIDEPSRLGSEIPALPGRDQLVVTRSGQDNYTIPLEKAQLTIGRSPTNDIPLPDEVISRRHARLERTTSGWRVTDLGSSNGSFLDSNKLLPDVPEAWETGQTLRIGPYFLRWQPAMVGDQPTGLMPAPPSGATQMFSLGGQLGIILNPTNIDVTPGRPTDVQVDLFNQGTTVDHFELKIQGIPQEWVTFAQESVQLMPGSNASLPITIHPPQNSSARAGRLHYRLIIKARTSGAEVASVGGNLNIQPFSRFSLDIRPKELRGQGNIHLAIGNEGNVQTTYTISGSDPGEVINFGQKARQVTIAAGEQSDTEIAIAPKQRPLLGTTKSHAFKMLVSPATGEAKSVEGRLEVPPRIPPWVLPLLLFLLVLLCAGSAYALSQYNKTRGEALANANATRDATDDDGDGLTNADEVAQKTDPQNADSDGDGLSDGEEVNKFLTLPLNDDTDGDGLKDGQEANEYHTDPKLRDTDGDGFSDGDEVNAGTDPGKMPPTSTPTLTPTATLTPTPSITPTATIDIVSTEAALEATAAAETAVAEAIAASTAQAVAAIATQTAAAIQTAESDADGDGLTFDQEQGLGTDPGNADTDGDGLKDGQEQDLGTDPKNADTDADGLNDGQEQGLGTDPKNADTDGDGLNDGQEAGSCTSPLAGDSDGDGAKDNEDPEPCRAKITRGNASQIAEIDSLGENLGNVNSIAYSPDGTLLAAGSEDNKVRVWQLSDGQLMWEASHPDSVLSVAFSHDGNQLASSAGDGSVSLWRASDGRSAGTLPNQPSEFVPDVAFSTDGRFLGAASNDGNIYVWQLSNFSQSILSSGNQLRSFAFAPNGGVAAGLRNGLIMYWPSAGSSSSTPAWTSDAGTEVWALDFSPTDQTLASGNIGGTVELWQISNGSSRGAMNTGNWVLDMDFSPDGQILAAATLINKTILFNTEERISLQELGSNELSVEFSPDGHRLATGSAEDKVFFWGVPAIGQ